MDAQVKAAWVAALKSGKYRQGARKLHVEDSFCCMGVLCDLYIAERKDGMWIGDFFYAINGTERSHESEAYLPDRVRSWAGLAGDFGFNPFVMYKGKKETLASLNDNGIDFATIADIIQNQL